MGRWVKLSAGRRSAWHAMGECCCVDVVGCRIPSIASSIRLSTNANDSHLYEIDCQRVDDRRTQRNCGQRCLGMHPTHQADSQRPCRQRIWWVDASPPAEHELDRRPSVSLKAGRSLRVTRARHPPVRRSVIGLIRRELDHGRALSLREPCSICTKSLIFPIVGGKRLYSPRIPAVARKSPSRLAFPGIEPFD